jgi:hypothetical protein
MIKIWGDKIKTIFETNLKNLINQIEYEKEINQFEECEQNIKKNLNLIEEFVKNNIKFFPIVEIFSFFLSKEKIPDNLLKEISKEKNLLHRLIQEILKDKNTLDLIIGNFEKHYSEVRPIIKTRFENKKLFELFQNRILDVLRRRVNVKCTPGREFSLCEENLMIQVNKLMKSKYFLGISWIY